MPGFQPDRAIHGGAAAHRQIQDNVAVFIDGDALRKNRCFPQVQGVGVSAAGDAKLELKRRIGALRVQRQVTPLASSA